MASVTLRQCPEELRLRAACCTASISKSPMASSSCWSVRPAAASRRLLRMIAGLEEVSGGEIRIGERLVNDVAPKDRDIAMVFQSYALYPHMDVSTNMGFSLLLKKAGEDRRSTPGSAAPPSGSASTLSSSACRASCPAASASASPWAAPSCAIPKCSCSTSRCPISTPSCACICAPRSRRCTSSSRRLRSMSPTTRSRR